VTEESGLGKNSDRAYESFLLSPAMMSPEPTAR
jgi:hypothetical protein